MSSCVAAKKSLTVYEGGTFDHEIAWEIGDPAVAVDLTGCQVYGFVKVAVTDTAYLIELPNQSASWVPDASTGCYLPDPINGVFKIYIKDEDTFICTDHADIVGVYNVFVNSPEDEVILKVYGSMTIKAAVGNPNV